MENEENGQEIAGIVAKSKKAPDRFKSIGSRVRGAYNFCQEQFAPDVKAREHWRRLGRHSLPLGDETFPGFYSEFDPRVTRIAFWLTIGIEGSIALYLGIYGVVSSGLSAVVLFPALTLFLDVLLASTKHLFDHKYAEWENAASVIRVTNVDYIGLKSRQPQDYSPKSRIRKLNLLRYAVILFKVIIIALLVFVAYKRIGIFIEHIGPAMTKWMSIPLFVVKVIGYVLVASTTLLHVLLTGRFVWYRWFSNRIAVGFTSISEQKYDSEHAIQWPRVRLIRPGFNDRRSTFSNLDFKPRNHDVANTNHGIRVIRTPDGELQAYLIQHGVLEDGHIKELCNAVSSDAEIRALACFLIKECQLDTVKEDETNKGNFVSFDEYPDSIRLEVLRRYRDFLLYQDEQNLKDNILVTHKKLTSNHRVVLIDVFASGNHKEKGRFIVDLIAE